MGKERCVRIFELGLYYDYNRVIDLYNYNIDLLFANYNGALKLSLACACKIEKLGAETRLGGWLALMPAGCWLCWSLLGH